MKPSAPLKTTGKMTSMGTVAKVANVQVSSPAGGKKK